MTEKKTTPATEDKTAKLIEITKNREELLGIAKIAKDILDDNYNIKISLSDAIPTIVYVFMENMYQYLRDNKSQDTNITIDFMGLMELGITYRYSEDGEKEGNFTPFIVPGPTCKIMIKDDTLTE